MKFYNTSISIAQKTFDGSEVFERALDETQEKDEILKIIYDDRMGNRVEREYVDAIILGFYADVEVRGIKLPWNR